MLPDPILPVLALPRAKAFAEGLLVPISPYVRRQASLATPLRFTAAAWRALIADPGRPLPREPAVRQERLDRVLAAIRDGLTDCATYFRHARTFTLIHRRATVLVLASLDEDGADVLTVALPSETTASAT